MQPRTRSGIPCPQGGAKPVLLRFEDTMTRIDNSLLILGAALICAPLVIYGVDSLVGLGRTDPLTLSTLIGGAGAGVLALSQRGSWMRFFLAFAVGLLVVALQVYGIAFLVLQVTGL